MSWESMDINNTTDEYKALLTYLVDMFSKENLYISFRHCKDTGYKVMCASYYQYDPEDKTHTNIRQYIVNLKLMKPTRKSLVQTPVTPELRELINNVIYPNQRLETMIQNLDDIDRQERLDKWKNSMGLPII